MWPLSAQHCTCTMCIQYMYVHVPLTFAGGGADNGIPKSDCSPWCFEPAMMCPARRGFSMHYGRHVELRTCPSYGRILHVHVHVPDSFVYSSYSIYVFYMYMYMELEEA